MVTIKTEASDKTLRGLLCSALEGGSNYWYMIEREELAAGLTFADFREGGKMTDPAEYWHPYEIIPFVDGCALIIGDKEQPGKTFRLDKAALRKGIEVMAKKFPRHFADVINENDDADTGDVFLQCCLFGDIIYG